MSPTGRGRGVVFYDHLRTNSEYSLIEIFGKMGHRCRVIDMYGEVVMSIPGSTCEIDDDGRVISNYEGMSIWNSELRLESQNAMMQVHHDIASDHARDEIVAWTYDTKNLKSWPRKETKRGWRTPLFLEDVLRSFDRMGNLIWEWKVSEHILEIERATGGSLKIQPRMWKENGTYELTHFNGVQILPANELEKDFPEFRSGNYLVSCSTCALIAIIDRDSKKIIWSYRVPGQNPSVHAARMTENGNIVFFRNSSKSATLPASDLAAIFEISPVSGHIVWNYSSPDPNLFSADLLGAVTILKNGNFLISHLKNGGGAFEISRSGRLVWEWTNSIDNPVFPGNVYRVRRLSHELVDPLLKRIVIKRGVPSLFFDP